MKENDLNEFYKKTLAGQMFRFGSINDTSS